MKTINFGEHLTIDGYNGQVKSLNSKKFVLGCLKELPKILSMKALAKPEVYFAPNNHLKDPGGWSGFVVVAESHISIHTFPGRRFLSADVYTCKNGMDTEFIKNYFKEKFNLQELETHFIKRGTKYPANNIA
ncbi:MAG: S-adenosylmethionine decarboxylase [Candidatus Komeilibacteria bacterium]|nr:S-adenosylmethionine decarboxylase [Candidatus Komeilibacteria bacterium]